MTQTPQQTATWDFPPLALAFRCIQGERSSIDPATLAETAVLFRNYGLGPLPDVAHLRDAAAWTAWLPICAATYCQRLVEQHRAMGTTRHLRETLKALADASSFEVSLLSEHDTATAHQLAQVYLDQLRRTAKDQLMVLQRDQVPARR